MADGTAISDDTATSGNEEFDQAFDEIATAESPSEEGADKDAVPASDNGQQEDPSPPDGNVSDDPPPPADGQAPTDQQPSDDIWANAPPELRAAYEASLNQAKELETKLTRQNGRVSALDRQLNQIRNQQNGQGQPKPDTDVSKLLETDKFKQFREEYPEIADPITEVLSVAAERLKDVSTVVDSQNQAHEENILNEQLGIFQSDHPDWTQYAEDPRWNDWVASQPRHIREAAARNREFIVDGSEASDVLSRFKQEHGIGTTPPPPPPTSDPRRDRQLDGARRPGTSAPSVATGDPDNFDAAFDNAAKKIDAQIKGRKS